MFKKVVTVLFSVFIIVDTSHANSYSRNKLLGDTQFTQVKIFTPWRYPGDTVHPSIKITKKVAGACSTASLVNPRPDAWRCKIENEVHDPCFINDAGQEVACIKSPWDKTAVLITLTRPLPNDQGNSQNYLEQNPWGIELDNNLRCVTSDNGIVPMLAGMAGNSICFNQASNITAVKFLDSFDQELPLWRVFIKQADLFLEQVPIKTAWY